MEDRELKELITELEGYQEIIGYYKKDPSKIKANRESLFKIQNHLFNLSPIYLKVQPEREISEKISALVSANQEDLSKLLLNSDLENLLAASSDNQSQETQ